jgi:hypothetical protein
MPTTQRTITAKFGRTELVLRRIDDDQWQWQYDDGTPYGLDVEKFTHGSQVEGVACAIEKGWTIR